MAEQGAPVAFRDARIEAELDARRSEGTSRGMLAQRDLARYYALLAGEVAAANLTEPEALLICDALNGTLFEPHTMRLLWAEIDDALGDDLAEKWNVDGAALVERLRALRPVQATAVVDAVERAWNAPDGPTPETLRAVGIVR